jgi:hypothetical protein
VNAPMTGPVNMARPGNRPSSRPAGSPSLAAGFDAYTAALEQEGAPLLGHLVLYSVFDGRVRREDLERWFMELGMDSALLPPPIRPVDAFEKITGRDGVRRTYPLDGQRPVLPSGKLKRRPANGSGREATLMVRHVRRDPRQIVRHLVREVRDESATKLTYDSRLAEMVFVRDTSNTAGPGAGSLRVEPANTAIAKLPEDEQATVRDMLAEFRETFDHRCTFYTADRLRTLIRSTVENWGALRVRPTGGVYFVHRDHGQELAALRELVDRMGEGSNLVRIPIPDQDEMRTMVISAFTNQARDDLNQLSADIAAARAAGASEQDITALHRRFTAVQDATTKHSTLLSTSLDDTDAALQLVNLQLAGLLAHTNDENDKASP